MNDHAMLLWTRIAAIATTALALATFVLAGFSYFQLKDSNHSQRAFVYVGGFSPIIAISKETKGRIVLLLLSLTNGGNTPTKNLHFFFRCAPSVDALPEPWVLLYREKPEYIPQVIGPKATVTAACSFTASQLTDMTEGKLHGYVLGEIFYEDFLEPGTVHKTQYSQEYTDVQYIPPPAQAPEPPPPAQAAVPSAQAAVPSAQAAVPSAQAAAPVKQQPPESLFGAFTPRGKHNCTNEDCPSS
jgi:hypothetical protein